MRMIDCGEGKHRVAFDFVGFVGERTLVAKLSRFLERRERLATSIYTGSIERYGIYNYEYGYLCCLLNILINESH